MKHDPSHLLREDRKIHKVPLGQFNVVVVVTARKDAEPFFVSSSIRDLVQLSHLRSEKRTDASLAACGGEEVRTTQIRRLAYAFDPGLALDEQLIEGSLHRVVFLLGAAQAELVRVVPVVNDEVRLPELSFKGAQRSQIMSLAVEHQLFEESMVVFFVFVDKEAATRLAGEGVDGAPTFVDKERSPLRESGRPARIKR